MKVVLSQDVPNVGKKWDVKEVKNGYGRNYLLARNLAKLATGKTLKEAEQKNKQDFQEKALQENLLRKSLESLKDSIITVEKKVNEKGHLFDGLDAREIAGILKEKINIKISPEHIELGEAIKEMGKHKITFRKGDWETSFEIEIAASNQ